MLSKIYLYTSTSNASAVIASTNPITRLFAYTALSLSKIDAFAICRFRVAISEQRQNLAREQPPRGPLTQDTILHEAPRL